jgi:deoxyribodipyrimidine photolyase-related protein
MFRVLEEIDKTDIKTIGNIDAVNFVWPRTVFTIIRFFLAECFGSFKML